MRKIAILAIVAAVIALLVLPAAAFADTTVVTGDVVGPTISITAPPQFSFGTFVIGWNPSPTTWMTSGDGNVTFDPGSDSAATWTISATSTIDASGNFTDGLMWSDSLGRYLAPGEAMYVSLDGGATYAQLPGGVTTAPSSASGVTTFQLSAQQYISHEDILAGAGTYRITVQLTASVTL